MNRRKPSHSRPACSPGALATAGVGSTTIGQHQTRGFKRMWTQPQLGAHFENQRLMRTTHPYSHQSS